MYPMSGPSRSTSGITMVELIKPNSQICDRQPIKDDHKYTIELTGEMADMNEMRLFGIIGNVRKKMIVQKPYTSM